MEQLKFYHFQLKNSSFYKKVKDLSVSGEVFELYHDTDFDLLKTQPVPENLDRYYQSADYISHTDGKRSLFEKVYHLVKTWSLKQKLQLIQSELGRKGSILDIGAGTGDFLVTAKSTGWDVCGFEPSESARTLAIQKGVKLTPQTQELPDQTFDVITMWHVLEHVPDVDAQISELKRLLKPGGLIVIAVPNFKSHDAEVYGEFWAAYDVPRHLTHFSRQSIAKLFGQQGLELKKYKPMWFDSFYVSLLSEKYRSGSMKPVKSLFNGLISNIKGMKSGEFSSHIYLIR